jgi:hypothetical protein
MNPTLENTIIFIGRTQRSRNLQKKPKKNKSSLTQNLPVLRIETLHYETNFLRARSQLLHQILFFQTRVNHQALRSKSIQIQSKTKKESNREKLHALKKSNFPKSTKARTQKTKQLLNAGHRTASRRK